ncbi:MAG: SpoIIE family protein phosphatase [Thiotrichaceae bacterium]
MVQTAVRTLLANNVTDPKVFLTVLNQTLFLNLQRMKSDKNLTLSLLDYQDGKLRLSGQHEEILLVRYGGEVERINTFDLGFIVGVEADISQFIVPLDISLEMGDGVVLYTDGVTEAQNQEKQQYSVERLSRVVSKHWHLSASEIQQAVVTDLRQHTGDILLKDDITLLVIKQR